MNRALWLLIRLQTFGWLRARGRGMLSLRGILLGLVGVGVVGLWLFAILRTPSAAGVARDDLLRHGPSALLGYYMYVQTFVNRSVSFRPRRAYINSSSGSTPMM